jgi:uncharacterized protein (DUF427 family)
MDYPAIQTPVNHVQPSPRRVRAYVGSTPIVDTTRALYVWEHPPYPQYYLPLADFTADVLVDEHAVRQTEQGTARVHGLQVGADHRPAAALVYDDSPVAGVAGTVRLRWSAADAWFEEDERIYVHPRDPYARVDAIRSSRRVSVSLDGVTLADSRSPVIVFETGLPPRYYLPRTNVAFEHLETSPTQTACPYKGTTSGYWTAVVHGRRTSDVAWTYEFPTRELLPIAGLIAFYNEKVDLSVDGVVQARPQTPFS